MRQTKGVLLGRLRHAAREGVGPRGSFLPCSLLRRSGPVQLSRAGRGQADAQLSSGWACCHRRGLPEQLRSRRGPRGANLRAPLRAPRSHPHSRPGPPGGSPRGDPRTAREEGALRARRPCGDRGIREPPSSTTTRTSGGPRRVRFLNAVRTFVRVTRISFPETLGPPGRCGQSASHTRSSLDSRLRDLPPGRSFLGIERRAGGGASLTEPGASLWALAGRTGGMKNRSEEVLPLRAAGTCLSHPVVLFLRTARLQVGRLSDVRASVRRPEVGCVSRATAEPS